jgi:hypothetical protein
VVKCAGGILPKLMTRMSNATDPLPGGISSGLASLTGYTNGVGVGVLVGVGVFVAVLVGVGVMVGVEVIVGVRVLVGVRVVVGVRVGVGVLVGVLVTVGVRVTVTEGWMVPVAVGQLLPRKQLPESGGVPKSGIPSAIPRSGRTPGARGWKTMGCHGP